MTYAGIHLILNSVFDNYLFLAGVKRAALYVGWSQEQAPPPAPNTKLSITHSFFELQCPDFAWKFV